MTAGHCFFASEGCTPYGFALGYTQAAQAAGELLEQRSCREIIIREVGQLADGSPVDYALVRLERPAVEPSRTAPLAAALAGEMVTSIGFPAGLPLKIDPNGRILRVDRTGLDLITDAYHGSSGSALYDAEGKLVGMLTSGQSDFVWDSDRGCNVSRVLGDDEVGTGERAMLASVVLARACYRMPNLELCPPQEQADGSTEERSAAEPTGEDMADGSVQPRDGRTPPADAGERGDHEANAADASVVARTHAGSSGCAAVMGAERSGECAWLCCAWLLGCCAFRRRRSRVRCSTTAGASVRCERLEQCNAA